MKKRGNGTQIAAYVISAVAVAAFALAIYGAVKEREMRLCLEEEIAQVEQMLEEQQEELEELKGKTAEELEVYLPDRLYVAVGRTMELYNAQAAFAGNREDFYFNWTCDIGRNLDRKFQVTGEGGGSGRASSASGGV